MNKIIRTFFAGAAVITLPAFADDAPAGLPATPSVTQRTDCAAVQAEIDTLSALEEMDETQTARLDELKTIQRRDCVKRATGRRSNNVRVGAVPIAAAASVPVVPVAVTAPVAEKDAIETFVAARDKICNELKSEMDKTTAAEKQAQMKKLYEENCAAIDLAALAKTEKTPEEIAALIEAGLCADGEKPNRFGCCAGETFKDLGNTVFGCCPDDGGECYPPISQRMSK